MLCIHTPSKYVPRPFSFGLRGIFMNLVVMDAAAARLLKIMKARNYGISGLKRLLPLRSSRAGGAASSV